MLCTPVFIFISSSLALLERPRCGLSIWLSQLAIFDTLFRVCQFLFSRENGQNKKILEVLHFRMIGKWPPTVTRCAKLRASSKGKFCYWPEVPNFMVIWYAKDPFTKKRKRTTRTFLAIHGNIIFSVTQLLGKSIYNVIWKELPSCITFEKI